MGQREEGIYSTFLCYALHSAPYITVPYTYHSTVSQIPFSFHMSPLDCVLDEMEFGQRVTCIHLGYWVGAPSMPEVPVSSYLL